MMSDWWESEAFCVNQRSHVQGVSRTCVLDSDTRKTLIYKSRGIWIYLLCGMALSFNQLSLTVLGVTLVALANCNASTNTIWLTMKTLRLYGHVHMQTAYVERESILKFKSIQHHLHKVKCRLNLFYLHYDFYPWNLKNNLKDKAPNDIIICIIIIYIPVLIKWILILSRLITVISVDFLWDAHHIVLLVIKLYMKIVEVNCFLS